MMKKHNSRRRMLGFTLTELMAVSAIVSSIPAGAYLRAQQKAHEIQCVNNLQQIGKSIVSYYLSEGKYPEAAFYPAKPAEDQNSIITILDGSGAGLPAALWICPAAPDTLQERGLTFVYNDTIGGRKSLPRPEKAWLLIEVNCVSKKVPAPHPSGYNILFADGHVVTTDQLPPSITEKQRAWLEELSRSGRLAAACADPNQEL